MLVLSRKKGESIVIGDDIEISIVDIHNGCSQGCSRDGIHGFVDKGECLRNDAVGDGVDAFDVGFLTALVYESHVVHGDVGGTGCGGGFEAKFHGAIGGNGANEATLCGGAVVGRVDGKRLVVEKFKVVRKPIIYQMKSEKPQVELSIKLLIIFLHLQRSAIEIFEFI